jgi:hypothetical protein
VHKLTSDARLASDPQYEQYGSQPVARPAFAGIMRAGVRSVICFPGDLGTIMAVQGRGGSGSLLGSTKGTGG